MKPSWHLLAFNIMRIDEILKPNKTLGESLRQIETMFNVSPDEMAAVLGIGKNDYATSKYRHNSNKPTVAWRSLLFMMIQFGPHWVVYSKYEPYQRADLIKLRQEARKKLDTNDYFIHESAFSRPPIYISAGELMVKLSTALLEKIDKNEWNWDDTPPLHELKISTAVRLHSGYADREYSEQIMRLIRTAMELRVLPVFVLN